MLDQRFGIKITKNTIAYLVALVVLLAAGIFLGTYFGGKADKPKDTDTVKESDAIRFSEEYTQVPEDNLFVYRSADQIIDILQGGTGAVFLGFPECQWCQAYAPILNSTAKESGLTKIYYFNIREDRSGNTENYQAIVDLLHSSLDRDDEGQPRVFVPDVTVVDRGIIIGHDNETSLISDPDITPEAYWTADAELTLRDKLRALLDQISGPACLDLCEE